MIIWISSFPRSGNTFLRTLLHDGFNEPTYSIYNDTDIGGDPELAEITGHQTLDHSIGSAQFTVDNLRASEELFFLKTHEIDRALVRTEDRVIYLIRDGREATFSYQKYLEHFNNQVLSYSQLTLGLTFPGGGWGDHVRNWAPLNNENTLLVRFENLVTRPSETLKVIGDFLNARNLSAEAKSFLQLNELNPSFFRSGKTQSYTDKLSLAEISIFNLICHAELCAYGYLDENWFQAEPLRVEATHEFHAEMQSQVAYVRDRIAELTAELTTSRENQISLDESLDLAKQEHQRLQKALELAQKSLDSVQKEKDRLLNSRSWKLTKPLRAIARMVTRSA